MNGFNLIDIIFSDKVDTKHVFVLGSDNLGSDGNPEGALATAFAIGATAVLSCSHCLTQRYSSTENVAQTSSNSSKLESLRLVKEYHTEYWLLPVVDSEIDNSADKIKIQLVKHHIDNDWALFKRTDGLQFQHFAPVDERLGPSVSESARDMSRILALQHQKVCIIHCPVGGFQTDVEDGTPSNVSPIYDISMIHCLTEHHLKHGAATISGASGGAIHVLGCRKAIGWHCGIVNRVKEFVNPYQEKEPEFEMDYGQQRCESEDIVVKEKQEVCTEEGPVKKRDVKKAKVCMASLDKKLESVSDTLASVPGNTNSQGVSSIISRHPKLMYYIVELNAGRL